MHRKATGLAQFELPRMLHICPTSQLKVPPAAVCFVCLCWRLHIITDVSTSVEILSPEISCPRARAHVCVCVWHTNFSVPSKLLFTPWIKKRCRTSVTPLRLVSCKGKEFKLCQVFAWPWNSISTGTLQTVTQSTAGGEATCFHKLKLFWTRHLSHFSVAGFRYFIDSVCLSVCMYVCTCAARGPAPVTASLFMFCPYGNILLWRRRAFGCLWLISTSSPECFLCIDTCLLSFCRQVSLPHRHNTSSVDLTAK